MGPQDPKDVARDTARDLSGIAGELAALKAHAEGTRLPLAHGPRVHRPAPPPGRCSLCGRGGGRRGKEAGKDERGAGAVGAQANSFQPASVLPRTRRKRTSPYQPSRKPTPTIASI